MAIIITVNQKGARVDSIEKLVREQIKARYPEASVSVEHKEPAESRADRYAECVSQVSDAKSEAESLRDELQGWYDNLPENFQQGDKGSVLEEAISSIEEFIDACDNAENVSVEFPGMY